MTPYDQTCLELEQLLAEHSEMIEETLSLIEEPDLGFLDLDEYDV